MILLINHNIFAEDDFVLNKLNFCRFTKSTSNNYEPEKFITSNNLLRSSGELSIYCGEKIIVHGTVVDQNCVPVADAKVYLWQVNCKGKYPYTPLRTAVKDSEFVELDQETTFTGNGIATTNNKGQFYFVTIYPERIHDLSPHANIRVEHYKLGSLQARLTLKGHSVSNPTLNPELGYLAEFVTENYTTIYDFKVVMPGVTLKEY
ncbi:MAG: dioxygenase [Rickettsiaceae bacterium]|nr:dioxygenase [Rickettsiaceae bacterium]